MRLQVARVATADMLREVTRALESDADVVVATSGSTGDPKQVVLSSEALRCSARGATRRLGGPGQWLAALPSTHIGGLGVYTRSVISGTTPVVMESGAFTAARFARATAQLRTDTRRYVSLVPAQVLRLLAAPEGVEALQTFDHVVIGGDALAGGTAAALARTHVRYTHTYGMTETSGGCLYDGVPLDGVAVRIDQHDVTDRSSTSGRVWISGPVLAQGYLAAGVVRDEAFRLIDDRRWFVSADLGYWSAEEQRWVILGRIDDVIVTGGHKVSPAPVARAVRDLPGVVDAAVVGVPDPDWGHAVAALVVADSPSVSSGLRADPRGWVRARLQSQFPRYALPHRVALATDLPMLASGKVDAAGVRTVFTGEDGTI